MRIGEAIDALEQGKKVARAGWNGKGMYIQLIPGDAISPPGDFHLVSPCIGLRTAAGSMQPGWNASTPDLFAADWEVVA